MPNIVSASKIAVRSIIQDSTTAQVSDLKRIWQVGTVTGAVTWDQAVVNLDAALSAFYKPMISNHAVYLGTLLRQVAPVVTDGWAFTNAAPVTGTGGATRMPDQIAGLLQLRTGLFGKRYAGRQYIPFPPTAANNDGNPDAGYQADAEDLGLFLISPYTITVGANSCVINCGLMPPAGPVAFAQFTDYSVPLSWATQRKRGAFGRFNKPPF